MHWKQGFVGRNVFNLARPLCNLLQFVNIEVANTIRFSYSIFDRVPKTLDCNMSRNVFDLDLSFIGYVFIAAIKQSHRALSPPNSTDK